MIPVRTVSGGARRQSSQCMHMEDRPRHVRGKARRAIFACWICWGSWPHESGPSWDQVQLLESATDPQSIPALMEVCGRANRTKFRDQVVRPLLEAGLLEMTIPDKPRSSRQRYRTTEAGRRILREESR